MSYKKIDINEIVLNPFKTIGNDWLLISALKDGVTNTMTASWGGIGVIWNKNVVTVYIRPQRYTREFVDNSDYFSLTFFEGYKKELGILGSKSGRDCDKIKETNFDHKNKRKRIILFRLHMHLQFHRYIHNDSHD